MENFEFYPDENVIHRKSNDIYENSKSAFLYVHGNQCTGSALQNLFCK